MVTWPDSASSPTRWVTPWRCSRSTKWPGLHDRTRATEILRRPRLCFVVSFLWFFAPLRRGAFGPNGSVGANGQVRARLVAVLRSANGALELGDPVGDALFERAM